MTPPSESTRNARPVSATRLPCYIFDTAVDLAKNTAQTVARVLCEKNALGQIAVLGLPAGSTPVGVYNELIRMHQEESLDFSHVAIFILDEFYNLSSEQLQSHSRWMREHLFDHINIPDENIHALDGSVPSDNLDSHCRDYEQQIQDRGGIDLLILGVGSNGHIGFNEPFGIRDSRTQLVALDPVSRRARASDFFSEDNVPTHAITMGLGTIMEAEKILLLALGEHKSEIIRLTCEEIPSNRVPASFMQQHEDATVLVDAAAGCSLTDSATPWVLGGVNWEPPLIKRAVLWLCEQTGKSLLKLNDEDFRNHNLHQLLRDYGPAPDLAHRVFRWMMETIDYHPAGKEPKKIICFSPHPDDDVISMGGSLIRLVNDGHEVHIAYMTSGNIAVFDHDALRVADLVTDYNRIFGIDEKASNQVEATVADAFAHKKPGEPDIDQVLKIKGLIRWSEAKAGALRVGCKEQHLHNLDLPFYQTGTIAKDPVGKEDVQIIRDLIEKVAPDQIYVAGDLSDPHGTHRVCAEAIFHAIDEIKEEGGAVPEVLLYRGAWQEYELYEIEIAVPLSPQDMAVKRQGIFMHESQKDSALFPGSDPREFWERAEDRNCGTADAYNDIGLPEYYAMEAFVRWKGIPI